MKIGLILFVSLSSFLALAHTRLVAPTPRNNNSGIKMGPCGGLARTATPTVLNGGQPLLVKWEETINHPGKFLISLSMANDANFTLLKSVSDDQNAGIALPHEFQASVDIPNINCDNCTLQMIQSMEENPAAPSFYYSCADIKIVASGVASTTTTLPSNTGGNQTQSASTGGQNVSAMETAKFGGGCGLVSSINKDKNSGGGNAGAGILFLAFPLLLIFTLRRRVSWRSLA